MSVLLRRGSRGKDVARIQRKLGVTADSVYGPITERAVRSYQSRHRLEVDGVVGPLTWASMFPAINPPKPKARVRLSWRRRKTMRARALGWLKAHRGITEQPASSNLDSRSDGIRTAQVQVAAGGTWLVGLAWCGVWACAAALAAGLGIPRPYRWASVALIEDDARARTNGFAGWTTNPHNVTPGDLVVLFGRGVHVETVRRVDLARGLVYTDGGNTSSGSVGSQSNGGGAFRRIRPLSDVHGFARVDYPN